MMVHLNGSTKRMWTQMYRHTHDTENIHSWYRNSRVAKGVKNLWATNFSGPQKTMQFWKVHYLALITWGGVYPDPWAYSV